MSADLFLGLPLARAIALWLAIAVVLASVRWLWRWRSPAAATRPVAWRAALLLLAQAGSAALLYCTLFPPARPTAADTLTVLTARAAQTRLPAGHAAARGHVVALPEAAPVGPGWGGAERVPDLATALRRYPAMRTVHVMGAGLVARDRPAARALDVRFHPAPLPAGVTALALPQDAAAGRAFRVGGHVQGLAGGQVELLDPSRRRVARADLQRDGTFELHAASRAAGLTRFTLRVRAADGRVVEVGSLPVQVSPARPLRALALAGAPDAELKFLRRWALDAGIDLATRIELGAGLRIASPRVALDAAALDRLDLLMVDERSWRGLGAGQRATVLAAVDRGLGLLLRVSAGATAADRTALRALGFSANPGPTREVRLGAGFVRAGDAVDALPPVVRGPLQPVAADGVVALADAAGTPLATWRARGRGRIGVSGVDETWRLVLAGRREAHGEVWGRLATVLARAQARVAIPRIAPAPPGERTVVCGVAGGMRVVAPDGRATTLVVDPGAGAKACAGFWATRSGWHALRTDGQAWPFDVPASTQWPAMQARELRDATLALAGDAAAQAASATTWRPGPRWPWFAAWLLLTAALWWLERSRRGLVPAAR